MTAESQFGILPKGYIAMMIDKDTGKEMTMNEAVAKLNKMTDEQKLELLDEIYKQLNIQPIKSGVL